MLRMLFFSGVLAAVALGMPTATAEPICDPLPGQCVEVGGTDPSGAECAVSVTTTTYANSLACSSGGETCAFRQTHATFEDYTVGCFGLFQDGCTVVVRTFDGTFYGAPCEPIPPGTECIAYVRANAFDNFILCSSGEQLCVLMQTHPDYDDYRPICRRACEPVFTAYCAAIGGTSPSGADCMANVRTHLVSHYLVCSTGEQVCAYTFTNPDADPFWYGCAKAEAEGCTLGVEPYKGYGYRCV